MSRQPSNGSSFNEASDRTPPLSPDEYATLDNAAATERMPEELAAATTTRRLTITAPGEDYARSSNRPEIVESQEIPGTWELELPQGASLGLPGRNAGRMSPAEVVRGIRESADSEPFQPPWVDFTPHPKLAAPRWPVLRRVNGSLVEPHYGVFGPDDRQVYYPSGYPWTCVGKIFVWNDFSQPNAAWSGSGVLIGGRVVLTAGHMAPWGSSNWAMQFIPAYYDGGSTLGAGVSSWVSDYWGYDTGQQVTAWDMLVLRLYTPLGATYGYFGTKTYDSAWQGGNYWTLAGYPGAVSGGNRPSRQMWFPVIDDDPDGDADEVEYLADATAGNSGGPAFGFWSGQPYSIGTHSGGEKSSFLGWTIEDNNVSAGGNALGNLVSWARNNWP